MNDLNDKLRERWQDRRKKGYNWTKLLVMVAILLGIILAMNKLNNAGKGFVSSAVEVMDSTAVDSLMEDSGE